jgi:hypothetical protein
MSLREWICVALIWPASLVAAGTWAHAQVIIQRPDIVQSPPDPPLPPAPFVVPGSNIGFRVIGFKGGKPVGQWVIRYSADRQWIEPEISN